MGLPKQVRVISMWALWASAVAAKIKTIETRTWPWPYEPGWLAIHASKRIDGPIEGRIHSFPPVQLVPRGALCALVYVNNCRELLPADMKAALVYRKGLWAWELAGIRRLRPHVMRGPQKFTHVSADLIRSLLV